jgi:signal transduction histidine kinase
MKKLTLSLVVAILTAIIFLGWSLDTFFNEYQEQKGADEFSAYREIITPLANTLDKNDNLNQFVTTWQKHNQQTLELTPLAEFPLPASLRDNFYKGEPLVLESENVITVNQLLPSQQKVLTLSIHQQTKQEDNLGLQVALTTVFYAGILLCVFIWLYPLIKRLRLLRITAKTFGEGDFSKRIHISSTSYIVDIENEFNRMAIKIETLIQDNKLLSNAVSHDLRTPLARLRFGIEALSETNKPETKEKYIQHLNSDIAEMEKLVAVLLNYARLAQTMVKVARIPVNLNSLVEECIHFNQSMHTHKLKNIDFSLQAKNSIIKGDIHFLSMLINNLLNNAQQYAKQDILVTTQNIDGLVYLTICDDGLGIVPEKRIELFSPFTRGQNTAEQTGYGMGLAIVARIADWHRAAVSIDESEKLGGAKLIVKFER